MIFTHINVICSDYFEVKSGAHANKINCLMQKGWQPIGGGSWERGEFFQTIGIAMDGTTEKMEIPPPIETVKPMAETVALVRTNPVTLIRRKP